MARRKFEASQIIGHLRTIEVLQGKGKKENSWLKKAVAKLTLDKLILKEAAPGNF